MPVPPPACRLLIPHRDAPAPRRHHPLGGGHFELILTRPLRRRIPLCRCRRCEYCRGSAQSEIEFRVGLMLRRPSAVRSSSDLTNLGLANTCRRNVGNRFIPFSRRPQDSRSAKIRVERVRNPLRRHRPRSAARRSRRFQIPLASHERPGSGAPCIPASSG